MVCLEYEISFEEWNARNHIERILMYLRKYPPQLLREDQIVQVMDGLKRSVHNRIDGTSCSLCMRKCNVLLYTLEDGSWFALRPSSREPKLILRYGASLSGDHTVTNKRLECLKEHIEEMVRNIHILLRLKISVRGKTPYATKNLGGRDNIVCFGRVDE